MAFAIAGSGLNKSYGICEAPNVAPYYVGVFSKRTGVIDYANSGLYWNAFKDLDSKLQSKGYGLMDIDPLREANGGKILWTGVWRNDYRYLTSLVNDLTLIDLKVRANDLEYAGAKLLDVNPYKDSTGRELWSGVWLYGPGQSKKVYFDTENDWSTFQTLDMKLKNKGYGLVDIESYDDSGKLAWAGIWRDTFPSTEISLGKSWPGFLNLLGSNNKVGLTLRDVATYATATGMRQWIGVWVEGQGQSQITVPGNWASFEAQKIKYNKMGLTLTDIVTYLPNLYGEIGYRSPEQLANC